MSSDITDFFTGSPGLPGASSAQPGNPDLHPAAGMAGSPDPVMRESAASVGGSGPGRAAAPDAEAVAGQAGRGSAQRLSAMLLPELQRMAQSMGITGTARMRKSQLVEAIQDRQHGGNAAAHTAHRDTELDNSAQRGASAGADAPRHREQDAMESDRSTQPGLGEGSYPATSGQAAHAGGPQGDAAGSGGSGADGQLSFDHSGAAASPRAEAPAAADAAPPAPGTAAPAGESQHGEAQRAAAGPQGNEGQRGDRRRRNNGPRR